MKKRKIDVHKYTNIKLYKIKDYLYEAIYNNLDYNYAYKYFEKINDPIQGACSVIRKGNLYGRNFDWIYDNQAEFVIETIPTATRYASIGIASVSNLDNSDIITGKYSDKYKLLPFKLVDGINEYGVIANVNVVPQDKSETTGTIPTERQDLKLCASMLIRFVLDNFKTAYDAVIYLKKYVSIYMPKSLTDQHNELHWIVADMNNTYLLECVNNDLKIIDMTENTNSHLSGKSYMTNFYLYDVILNNDGSIYTPETQDSEHNAMITNNVTQYGMGLERYNLISERYNNINTIKDMKLLMDDLTYSKSYKKTTNPFWYTEFVGNENTTGTSYENFSEVINRYINKFNHRTREPGEYFGTWETSHQSIYKIAEKELYVSVKEDNDDTYRFTFDFCKKKDLVEDRPQFKNTLNGNVEESAVRVINNENETTRDHYYKELQSYSHIMGMISAYVTEYIKSGFPKNYFSTIWNSMEDPYVERSKKFKDAMSKPRPLLCLIPKFDPSDESEFIPQSEFDPEIPNHPDQQIKIGIWNSTEIAGYNNFRLFAKPRRYKMSFDLKFIFDSDALRIQAQEYIRQNIRHKTPIQLHTYLENIIPETYMKTIAEMNGFDYKSDEFLKFINQFSINPITRRLRTGSGNYEFFAMVRTPIDIHFPDAPITEGPARKGNMIVSSAFSDYVTIEFVSYAVYFLVTSENMGNSIIYNKNNNQETDDGSLDMVGINNLYVLETPDTNYLENGCIKIKSFTVQADSNGDDSVNLISDGIINDAKLLQYIKHFQDKYKEIDFIHTVVYEDCEKLDGARYNLNRKDLTLTIKDMTTTLAYNIYIYLDMNKINDELRNIFIPDDYEKIVKGDA